MHHCAYCGKSYVGRREFLRHMMLYHTFSPHLSTAPLSESSPSSLFQPTPSTSGQCPPPLPSPTVSTPAKHQCTYCGKSYRHSSSLWRHKKSHGAHELKKLETLPSLDPPPSTSTLPPEGTSSPGQCPPSSPAKHQCSYREKSYDYQSSLLQHTKSHFPNSPLPPSPPENLSSSGQCPPKNTTKSSYECIECGKSYNWQWNLIYHVMSSHPAIRHERCNYCGETFYRKLDLFCHLNFSCPAILAQTHDQKENCTHTRMSDQQVDVTDRLDGTERTGENALCEEDLEAVTILMSMKGGSSSSPMSPNTPHNDLPRTPPDLPASVQQRMDEESFNQDTIPADSNSSDDSMAWCIDEPS